MDRPCNCRDQELMCWPPRSPDLILYDFFLCGFIKGRVFVPPLSATLVDLYTSTTAVITVIDHDMLQRVDYQLDVCHVTGETQIEHL
jgi:hypothetical protein